MTPEREDTRYTPRKEKAESALHFHKEGPDAAEPDSRTSPVWKKAAARANRDAARSDYAAPGNPVETPAQQPEPFAPVEYDEPENGVVEPETAPQAASGQSVPKYRQHSRQEAGRQDVSTPKYRRSSNQPPPAEKLHRDGGAAPRRDQPEPDKVRKARERMDRREGKVNKARDRLERQKPIKQPGAVKRTASWAAGSVHSYVHGKVYEAEQENVGVEGAHRVELVGEAAGRKTIRFTKQRIRNHPAQAFHKAEGQFQKAAGNYRFQQAAAEHSDLRKNALSRTWRKHQQKKRYRKQAQEAAKQSAKAAEKTAVTMEKAGKAVVDFIKRHPVGSVIVICCVLLLMVMQSCTSSLAAIGNGVTGSVAATTYPAEDADMLGAEAAYAAMEADLQSRLDNYEATHSYDEYIFDLDSIEHDPYVLMSILSALHSDGWTLGGVQGDLQFLFDRQYILTETVTVETRYRTETQTDDEGNETEIEVPYDYYICTVKLENFNLSHVPVYIMGEDQLSRYSLYMAALGNRPDLFPGSGYIGRYGGPITRYDIPPEALADEQFAAMIKEAEKYLGYPYVWGGSSPSTSFDCSGFVSWVVNHCGMGWDFGRCGSDALYFNVCTPIAPSEAKPGDLIFFQKTYDTPNTSHVGIYVGNGMMLHCGDPIQYTSINTSYWQAHFYGFGRLPSVN